MAQQFRLLFSVELEEIKQKICYSLMLCRFRWELKQLVECCQW